MRYVPEHARHVLPLHSDASIENLKNESFLNHKCEFEKGKRRKRTEEGKVEKGGRGKRKKRKRRKGKEEEEEKVRWKRKEGRGKVERGGGKGKRRNRMKMEA